MIRFLVTRILSAIPVLFVLSVVTFAIIVAPPGDYGDYIKSMLMSQGGATDEQAQKQADAYRASHGLNDPLPVQYVHWITGVVTRFDFGQSLFYNRPVRDVVLERLPRTILLALTCHILASLFGISLGIIAATRQYSWADTALSALSFLGMTIPRFLLAIIILYVLAFKLNSQSFGSFFSIQYGGAPWSWAKFVDLVKHVWPVVFIATFGGLAYNMRVMRANLLDVLNSQYVETARAKGLSEGRGHPAPRGAERDPSADRLPGRRAPLHGDRRDRDGDRLRAADRRPRHRRFAQHRRRLGDRDVHAGAGDDADRRQHHCRSVAGRARSAHPLGGGASGMSRHRDRFVIPLPPDAGRAMPTPATEAHDRRRSADRPASPAATKAIFGWSGGGSGARPPG